MSRRFDHARFAAGSAVLGLMQRLPRRLVWLGLTSVLVVSLACENGPDVPATGTPSVKVSATESPAPGTSMSTPTPGPTATPTPTPGPTATSTPPVVDTGAFDRKPSEDFDGLEAAGNTSPSGIWSDWVTMWVADSEDEKIYAYDLATRARVPGKDFETLKAAGNTEPRGIWSDGVTMWVADRNTDKIYAYDMPPSSAPPYSLPRLLWIPTPSTGSLRRISRRCGLTRSGPTG